MKCYSRSRTNRIFAQKNEEHIFKRDFKINHKMKINKLIFWIEG